MNIAFVKELFAGFVRSRAITRHFRRRWLPVAMRGAPVAREAPAALTSRMLAAARMPADTLLAELGSRASGLTRDEADAARARHGPNEIDHEKPLPWPVHLWHCYRNPFNLLLTALAFISYITEDVEATVIIGLMVILSTLLRFWQEGKSNRAADRLKEMVSSTATVLRPAILQNGASGDDRATSGGRLREREEVAIRLLVPGDVIALSAGDMIPADLRLLAAKDLFVNQSAMTGESMPVEKFPQPAASGIAHPFEAGNLLFMGTNVVSGSATAVVVSTGSRTYFGALAQHVNAADRAPTAFQAGINQVSWLLIRFMLVMAPVVLLINGYTKGDWLQALLFSLSVAVGLTPEMLPMIVTSTLAKGAIFLSRKKVIVKRLDAIQNFGAMDVLCTDKTGTLTQDRVVLARHLDASGEESDAVLEYAYLNSHYQTGLKNLLDVAVLEHVELRQELMVATAFRKVDEIPFDFQRRRMSVVVAERDRQHLLICKGAVEEILAVCTRVRVGGTDRPITAELLADTRALAAGLNEEGLRVVSVAVREMPPAREIYGVADEAGLTLIGHIAFLDPPKESAAPALRALAEHGVAVKVLTGDNERVTAKVCRDVGLAPERLVLGAQVEAMDDGSLRTAVETVDVFCRLTPAHKERIVRALRANGHVTGFLGDGINDAPALRAADIGISVDSGVDIAKEAADIILLEKSLMVLEEGVLEGRNTFANMLKYIRMAASSNFGNVFSVLVASVFLPFLPMLPLHLLVQNLLYDISQTAIPLDKVDEELLRRPQRWRPDQIARFMVYFGPVSSVFDLATFAIMWFVFSANTVEEQTLFQSGWFVVGLLTQTLIVHMIRTPKVPFLQSRAAMPLLAMTALIAAVGIYIPMGPLATHFKLQALPPLYFLFLAAILLGYAALAQAVKGYYVRRFGWQ